MGNGNVAIDVARVLLKPVEDLATTDIAAHAIEALKTSKVRRVSILGRRGPVQGAFATKELRELCNLEGVKALVHHAELELDPECEAELSKDRAKQRQLKILQGLPDASGTDSADKEVVLRFCISPVKVVADGRGVAASLRCSRMKLTGEAGNRRAVSTEDEEEIPAQGVLRSIGYQAEPICGLMPFESGLLPNGVGRVHDAAVEGGDAQGLYVAGWLKRGPSGIIGTNIADAKETAAAILHDHRDGKLCRPQGEDVAELLARLDRRAFSWAAWERLDCEEVARGEATGKIREKVISVTEMNQIGLD